MMDIEAATLMAYLTPSPRCSPTNTCTANLYLVQPSSAKPVMKKKFSLPHVPTCFRMIGMYVHDDEGPNDSIVPHS